MYTYKIDMESDMESLNYQLKTPLNIYIMNKHAIVIDLSSVVFPQCEVSHPHATLIFRHNGFSTEQLETVRRFINTELTNVNVISFGLKKWGKRSFLITGELKQLMENVMQNFYFLYEGSKRPPHVELFEQHKCVKSI